MKQILILCSLLIAIAVFNHKTSASPNPNFGGHFGFFYSSLSPHGEWIEVEPGFRVWRPFHISRQWRPYLIGRWVWTDYGWYWMSREPFGWITFHYGRWYYDDFYGWVWMPDDVWGPAWVEWRYDDAYIGWAPLPPYATFRFGIGIRFTTHWVAPVHYWNFVKYHRFGSVFNYRDMTPEKHTRRLISTSRSIQQFESDRDRIINRGIDRNIIEQRGNIRISRADVQEVREKSGERMVRSYGDRQTERIEVFRPNQEEMQRGEEIRAKRGERSLSIDMNKVERRDINPTTNPNERSPREGTRQNEQRREQTVKPEEQPREQTPRLPEQRNQRDRKEMRRELLQRHDQNQNPSPPAIRETQQNRIERKRESSSQTNPSSQIRGTRQDRKTETQRSR